MFYDCFVIGAIRGFLGDVAGAAHRDAEVGLFEGRRIIDAVADKRNALAFLLKSLHQLGLLSGPDVGKNVFRADARLFRNAARSQRIVARDQIRFQALALKLHDNFACPGLHRVLDRKQST